MKYADPHACPACRGRIDGRPSCPHCGAALRGRFAAELWQQMVQADALVAHGRLGLAPLPAGRAGAGGALVRYADPHACPACRGRIDGQPSCPRCGLALRGPTAARLWEQMIHLDRLVARSQGPAAVIPPLPGVPPRRGLDAGAVVLGLGALLLLVAATIFISVSWDQMGLFGRSMVLLGATVAAAAVATATTWRRLRASSEALWAVTLGLLTLDWFAARAQGLLGFDQMSDALLVGGWSVLMTALGVPVAHLARRRVQHTLVTPQLFAAIAAWGATPIVLVDLWADADWRAFWAGAVATAVAFLVVALGRWLRATVALVVALPLVLAFAAFLAVTAIAEAIDGPTLRGLVLDAHGLPLLLIGLGAAAATAVLRVGRVAAAAVATSAAFLLVITAVSAETTLGIGGVVAGVLLAAGAWAARGGSTWARGAQLTLAAVALIAAMTVFAGWVGEDVDAWAVGALAFGIAVAVTAAPSWAALPLPAALRRPGAVTVAAWGVLATLVAARAPEAVQVGVGLVVAIAVTAWLLHASVVEQWVGPALLVLALVPAESDAVRAWAFAVAAVVAAAVAVLSHWRWVVAVIGIFAVVAAAAAGVAFCWTIGLDERAVSLWLLLVALAAFGVASWFVDDTAVRVAVETTAGVVALASLLAGIDTGSVTWFALLFLVIALASAGAALDLPDRRWYAIPAGCSAVLAWLCFVVGEEFAAVEAFTVPLAALALGIGAWFLRRDRDVRTVVALGAGLALAFLPSLPQALDEPTGLRAGLLAVAAVAALALGAWRSWQAPFVAGAVVLAILVLANVWPVAVAMERWILFAVLGVLLLVVGVTWESRVRQGRAAWRAIAHMR